MRENNREGRRPADRGACRPLVVVVVLVVCCNTEQKREEKPKRQRCGCRDVSRTDTCMLAAGTLVPKRRLLAATCSAEREGRGGKSGARRDHRGKAR